MGRQLGRYELLRPIARGGMAEVYLARRRGPGGVEKQLVVKRIAREKSRDPRFAEMFIAEAQLSMSLAHKNIVPVFDFGRAGDELFLVMEFVDGVDLGRALKSGLEQDRTPSPMVVAYIGLEASLALDYAHGRQGGGVIHRDVTPGNVLLSSSGEVKLADFGVASLAGEIGDGRVRGTPSYMSPEQARGESVTEQSDLFSLGLVLWEALAGRRAYPGSEPREILESARGAELPALPDSVPDALAEIVSRATTAALSDRVGSARELYRDLDRYLLSARAREGVDDAPLTTQLASWVRAVEPPGAEPGELVDVPAGAVVTFLEDGMGELRSMAAGASDATMRSMAATVVSGELPSDTASDGSAGADGETRHDDGGSSSGTDPGPLREPLPRSPSRRWPALVLALLLPAALYASWRIITGAPGGEPPLDPMARSGAAAGTIDAGPARDAAPGPGSSDAAVADAGPPIDARPADAGSAASISPPDAGRKPTQIRRRRVDAGPVTGDKSPAAEPGTVRVSSSPWARVEVAGQSAGCPETPCSFVLPPGRHRLLLVNPADGRRAEVEVDVEPGGTHTVRKSLPAPR